MSDQRIVRIYLEDGTSIQKSHAYYFKAKELRDMYKIGSVINVGDFQKPEIKKIIAINILN